MKILQWNMKIVQSNMKIFLSKNDDLWHCRTLSEGTAERRWLSTRAQPYARKKSNTTRSGLQGWVFWEIVGGASASPSPPPLVSGHGFLWEIAAWWDRSTTIARRSRASGSVTAPRQSATPQRRTCIDRSRNCEQTYTSGSAKTA